MSSKKANKFSSDLIIIGAGGAGMMAGVAAGGAGIRTLILERKNKPGRKLLMCGNSRCNLTTNISADRMVHLFGEPMSSFVKHAFEKFTPSELQRWFSSRGLKTVVKTGNKVYPHTERATDVLNLFLDQLRQNDVSMAVSSPVESIEKYGEGYIVHTPNFSLSTRFIILSTGGMSYPMTGSVGDGQNFAKQQGHTIAPYTPGLVGYDVDEKVLAGRIGQEFDKVKCKLFSKEGKEIAETRGVYKIEKWGIGGTAITNTSRFVSRQGLTDYKLRIEFENGKIEEVKPIRPRPLKEAMVTVGGVSLHEIDNRSMESKKSHGIYFAGEVMDVDGPTGGYNLHSSFATARLAVASIADKMGKTLAADAEEEKTKNKSKNSFRAKGNRSSKPSSKMDRAGRQTTGEKDGEKPKSKSKNSFRPKGNKPSSKKKFYKK